MLWSSLNHLILSSLSLRDLFGSDPANIGVDTLNNVVQTLINWATGLAGTVALIYLVYGGIQYMTSAGNSKQTETAKATITWSIIGLIVVISAYAIVMFFKSYIIKPM